MELLEFVEALKKLFELDAIETLGDALALAVKTNDTTKFDAFRELVNDELDVDHLQKVYQYYCADRVEKKQDYTPRSLAALVAALTPPSSVVVDLCAGSGALTIQKWKESPTTTFELYELDERVLPFLLFNLALRNIEARVFVGDALDDSCELKYQVSRGSVYGRVAYIESTF